MKKALIIFFILVLCGTSVAEAKEDLSNVRLVKLIQLNEKQIQEAISDNKLFGYFINGVEFEEIHYANGSYWMKVGSEQYKGHWKIRGDPNPRICYLVGEGKVWGMIA